MRIRRISLGLHRHAGCGVYSRTVRPHVAPRPWHGVSRGREITSGPPREIEVDKNNIYKTDEWMNTPSSILAAVPRRLHLQKDHPLAITRELIESRFPDHKKYNNLFPVVTVGQNFDSLGFPADHIGRSRTDTYYLNKDTVLRTHTSAHQADTFRANESAGYLITADVYRRDAIDRSHYPVFHQMEGARTWDRTAADKSRPITDEIWDDVARIPKHSKYKMHVEDTDHTTHPERNPIQNGHSIEEVDAMAAHLKRSLEDMAFTILTAARTTAAATGPETAASAQAPLQLRWVEAYFPFTSPSWELEVYWQGDWLEVLGSGIVQQSILNNAGVPNRIGWAFGLGLERIAMLLYSIPDIRLFWSTDTRFLSQFKSSGPISPFVPFSKYPACIKDVSFWLPARSSSSAAGGISRNVSAMPGTSSATTTSHDFHENDVMEIAREVCGDVVEDVRLVDEFVHPKTGRKSMCYRTNYRSLERTLTNDETNELHDRFRKQLVEKLGVELR